MKAKKNVDERKYVVYLQSQGRQKIGIVYGWVTIDGQRAYVRRIYDSKRADVVPASNVFNTHEAAEKYLSGVGVRQWVVGTEYIEVGKNRYRLPIMFEALVLTYSYTGSHYVQNQRLFHDLKNNVLPQFYGSQARTFKNKRQAESAYAKLWREHYKDNVAELSQNLTQRKRLLARAPRARKRKTA